MAKLERDPCLPARLESMDSRATYSWTNPFEKSMREQGVDFRPPSVGKSWFWTMDNSQFGSDAQWMPKGDQLSEQRDALLLEYLPDARRMDSPIVTKKLAFQAFAGALAIQKALVRHGDQFEHNLLVTRDGRAVWVDFDRAEVFDSMNDAVLLIFKQDLIRIHRMLFTYMVSYSRPIRSCIC